MSWLAESPVFGVLALETTLVFYDGPRVFLCRSATDQLYLSIWAEERDASDLWLYVPTSSTRSRLLTSGRIDLRTALLRPEGAIYVVEKFLDDTPDTAALIVDSEDVQEDWLPADNVTFDLPDSASEEERFDAELLARAAVQEYRTRLAIRIVIPFAREKEISTRAAGELLISAQNLYDNVAMAIELDSPPQAGRVPTSISEEITSDLVGLRNGSVVLELAARNLEDLLGDSLFTRATTTVLALLDTTHDRAALAEQLSQLKPRGAKSFKRFIRSLAVFQGEATIVAAGAQLPLVSRNLPAERLNFLSQTLNDLVPDETTRLVTGRFRLFQADSQRARFGLSDDTSGQVYEGEVEARARQVISRAIINGMYDATILETSSTDDMIGDTRTRFQLLQLLPAEEQDA